MSDDKINDLTDFSSVPAFRDFDDNLMRTMEDATRQIFDYLIREADFEIWPDGGVEVWREAFGGYFAHTKRALLSDLVQAAVDDDGYEDGEFVGLESELRKSLEILEKRLSQGKAGE